MGSCVPYPTCFSPHSVAFCGANNASISIDDNTPGPSSLAAAVVDGYTCAAKELGPERSFILVRDASLLEEDVTVSLQLVDKNGIPLLDQTVVDLDLLVLEDSCTKASACANPPSATGSFGITAGTSAERVTFHAGLGKTYYLVVDGKKPSDAHPFALSVDACGRCQPKDGNRLSCDMSMPVSGNTSTGAAKLTDYMCGSPLGDKTLVSASGKEVPYFFETRAPLGQNVVATLTGAADGVTLLELPQGAHGECAPETCEQSAIASGGTASLTFAAEPGSTLVGEGVGRYFLIVDAPSTVDSPFGLELACHPSCKSTGQFTACGGPLADERKELIGTTGGQLATIDHWGPGAGCDGLTGLMGPEIAVPFYLESATDQTYTLTLESTTAGVSLTMTVLDAGTMFAPLCDPTLACRANTVFVEDGVYSGSRTAGALPASVQFTAQAGHSYYVPIDSAGAVGGGFKLRVIGNSAGAGCQ